MWYFHFHWQLICSQFSTEPSPPPPYHKLKLFTNLSPVNEIKINEQTYISNKITKRGKAILKFAIYKVVTIRHCTYRLSAAILQMLQIASVY